MKVPSESPRRRSPRVYQHAIYGVILAVRINATWLGRVGDRGWLPPRIGIPFPFQSCGGLGYVVSSDPGHRRFALFYHSLILGS